MRINLVKVVVWVFPTHKSFACFVSFYNIPERNFTFVSNGNIYGCVFRARHGASVADCAWLSDKNSQTQKPKQST